MNSKGSSHEHVLRSLNNLTIGLKKVASLQGLESEEVVVEVSRIIEFGINFINVLLYNSFDLGMNHAGIAALLVDHGVEDLNHLKVIVFCLLVKVRNFDSGSKLREIGMNQAHVSTGFGRKSI